MGPQPIDLTSKSTRVGAHGASISGTWRRIETDLTHHDEDTTLKVADQTVSMTDKMGRSFQARLDGTDAPYNGSQEFDAVSLKLINPMTLQESWTLDPDGKTIHARFDDLHGRVQEQTGHKLP
jgi:hypothetical protein